MTVNEKRIALHIGVFIATIEDMLLVINDREEDLGVSIIGGFSIYQKIIKWKESRKQVIQNKSEMKKVYFMVFKVH